MLLCTRIHGEVGPFPFGVKIAYGSLAFQCRAQASQSQFMHSIATSIPSIAIHWCHIEMKRIRKFPNVVNFTAPWVAVIYVAVAGTKVLLLAGPDLQSLFVEWLQCITLAALPRLAPSPPPPAFHLPCRSRVLSALHCQSSNRSQFDFVSIIRRSTDFVSTIRRSTDFVRTIRRNLQYAFCSHSSTVGGRLHKPRKLPEPQ